MIELGIWHVTVMLVSVLFTLVRHRGVGQDHVNTDFSDSALLLPEFVWRKEKAVLLG